MEKKTSINLLGIQIGSEIGKKQENMLKAEKLLEENLNKYESDVVILPEVWNCGWNCEDFRSSAEYIHKSETVEMLKSVAKKYSVNVIGGSFIQRKPDDTYYNTCPVIDKWGNLICTYEKNHLFSYYGDNEGDYVNCGKNPVMVTLDGVKFGLTICYDIRFPEIYRAYRIAGADVLINMAAWGYKKKIAWDSMTTSRAVENQTYMVALTQTGFLKGGNRNLGHSMILDYKGEILSEITGYEGAIFAKINLSEMYDFRNKCTILNDIKDSYEVELK